MSAKRLNSYKGYTVGCAIAWAILWIVVGTQSSDTTKEHVLFFFLGWIVGWTSATIARAVYPPPASRRSS
jgi:hypothetical protein